MAASPQLLQLLLQPGEARAAMPSCEASASGSGKRSSAAAARRRQAAGISAQAAYALHPATSKTVSSNCMVNPPTTG